MLDSTERLSSAVSVCALRHVEFDTSARHQCARSHCGLMKSTDARTCGGDRGPILVRERARGSNGRRQQRSGCADRNPNSLNGFSIRALPKSGDVALNGDASFPLTFHHFGEFVSLVLCAERNFFSGLNLHIHPQPNSCLALRRRGTLGAVTTVAPVSYSRSQLPP